ncbi:MAG: alpha/beta hydrolase family protein [Intrasporangium sp.]|uniref:alpha/beta hydrolase family protein n=1 Tax=Intrasporangium sp. TaxID=1925024 RepID=UPI003F7DFA66
MPLPKLVSRPLLVAGVAGGSALVGAAGGSLAAGAYFARKVLTPDEEQPDDVVVLACRGREVTLGLTPETIVPGRYGLWLDGGAGHARLGQILRLDGGSVTRELLGVDRGRVRPGPARWDQYWYWDRPRMSMGIPDEDAMILTELGPVPAWIVRPESGRATGTWAVLVHGRGARKEETLRAVPVLRRQGVTSLVVGYRNDRDAPRGPDGRYTLGLSEWRDVDAALRHAVRRGARRVVLFGWSMGGAIALQVLDNSALADRIAGVVLDSAVVDWAAVMRHHAHLQRVPGWLVGVTTALMGMSRAGGLVGIREPIDVGRTDWVRRSAELDRPMLVMHSDGDDFVPIGPAAELARRRPDIVRFERWEIARHCREWNYDPERWERVVGEFLSEL